MPNIPELKIGSTTYKLKDAELRQDILLVKNQQPTEECNRIWVKESTSEEYQVPTMDDFAGVNINLPNMLDGIAWVDGKYIDGDGNEQPTTGVNEAMKHSPLIEIKHPDEYVFTFVPQKERRTARLHGYDKNGNWKRQLAAITVSASDYGKPKVFSFRATDCRYITISICKYYNGVYLGETVQSRLDNGDIRDEVNIRGVGLRKNLLAGVGYTEYGRVGDNGAIITSGSNSVPYYRYTDLVEVVPGKRYFLTFMCKEDHTLNPVYIDGYNSNNVWVKRLRTVFAEEQTAGTASIIDFYTEECAQIRISIMGYYFYGMTAYDDLDESIMQSLFVKETIPFEAGSLNTSTGGTHLSAARIRSVGFAELAAEFIRGENVRFTIYIYNRNGQFRGLWDGTKLVHSGPDNPDFVVPWFTFVDVREIYNTLGEQYPNFVFKMTAMRPDGTITVADSSKIHFYTKEAPYSTVGVYETWAVIGASSDAGRYVDPPVTSGKKGVDHPYGAWPAILARRVGNTVYNYSESSRSLHSFVRVPDGLETVLRDPAHDLYVIDLGGNDATLETSEPIGTLVDITQHLSDGQYPDSVYGNYGKIMSSLKAHAPNAKFILTTPSGIGTSVRQLAVDNAVREIAAYYKVACIEWESDEFMRCHTFTHNFVENHPTRVLYGGKALAFERLFSRCVAKYIDYFNK